MFALRYLKRRAAVKLDSATLEMDAACSFACIVLSSALFVGSLLGLFTKDAGEEQTTSTTTTMVDAVDSGANVGPQRSTKWWWADSAAALVIAVWVGREGAVALRYALSDNFAGGCGCGKVGPNIGAAQARLLEQINTRKHALVDQPVVSSQGDSQAATQNPRP